MQIYNSLILYGVLIWCFYAILFNTGLCGLNYFSNLTQIMLQIKMKYIMGLVTAILSTWQSFYGELRKYHGLHMFRFTGFICAYCKCVLTECDADMLTGRESVKYWVIDDHGAKSTLFKNSDWAHMYVGLSKTLIELQRSSRFLHLGSYPTATFLGLRSSPSQCNKEL